MSNNVSKKILFIEDGISFLVSSVIDNLKQQGFVCDQIGYDVNELNRLYGQYTAIFLFLENDTVHKHEDAFVFLKDESVFDEKKIFLMGDMADNQEAMQFLDSKSIWDTFVRPVNAKVVCELIQQAFFKASRQVTKKHILVVDDSGTFLHTIKEWLQDTYKISVVNSATSAIAFLGKVQPDLILLDYEMPVCDGPMMLQMLKSDTTLSDIPVIFLTGKGDAESIKKVLTLRPDGYILKSLPREKILEMLKDFFKKKLLS